MARTQADLDAINEAIDSGALTVKYADKEITYRSLGDLYRIRNDIRDELSGVKRVTRTYGRYYKFR